MSEPRQVTLLGSTGSIGRQAIAVAHQNPDRLQITGLAAGGGDVARLAEQALALGVRTVAVARATSAQDLQLAFYAEASKRGWAKGEYSLPEILAGPRAAEELAARPADVVLNGITGSIGLRPTLAALQAGRTVALANKESLIAGGALVTEAAAPGQLVPVDSEHSALAQCLRGGSRDEVARLVLTASGGPFRGRTPEQLADVTVEQALAHPTWAMGPVVTINSATLVNKGLELIEAHLLFGVPYADIDVVVHPQSIVHSMVTFADGATIAQASPPDMRLPIALALAWPERLPVVQPALDWSSASSWEFFPLDDAAFPAVRLARVAGEAGGVVPALYNAANEEAVAAFVAGRLSFRGIVDLVARTLDDAPDLGVPTSVEDVLAAEKWAREHARAVIGRGM
ncbi:1-deoxy-D-xylulose-5-phosphate reductoisomerase [Blastococcus haudaquaticus]|uniref:1-deoxy-D-xylulose 5-phosphate reductoisomerase n=1 Tax=Blastococcus haudaquaticus TaxID=1938745 RepID=A0A286GBL4_9ACTN|nr:1-deoxy-D-xylulose-5-phosphate reductoisomerase [Blastococcus haudaquaticus]SOD92900.1 1-deoxy-D-xylulose 5-phosphate reductoisomerase [Blastococcus haudaquaticus]